MMNSFSYFIARSFFSFLFFISLSAGQRSEEKSIVVIIPSYKNSSWYKKNLDSVLCQKYSNFRVIYTDDCSPDNTGNLVEAYLKDHDFANKVTLIKNSKRIGALHNLYTMIHSCDDDDIIVTLDGDDWFPDGGVLRRLNDVYCKNDVWLTYGQFTIYPEKEIGWAIAMPDEVVKNNRFRYFEHLPTHLRTFYAGLFKQIQLRDLLYFGDFYEMSWDMAIMFPMIEMAGERHRFIKDVMYVYNNTNSISDHRVSRQLQAHLAQIIKAKRCYKPLESKPRTRTLLRRADAIIFSDNGPDSLEKLLDSIEMYVVGIDKIFVLIAQYSQDTRLLYEQLNNKYPSIEFLYVTDERNSFKYHLANAYQQTTQNYIFFAKTTMQFISPIDLARCIQLLKGSHAFAFYFKLTPSNDLVDRLIELPEGACAWNFSLVHNEWSCANSFDSVLHKKKGSIARFMQSNFQTAAQFEALWANEGRLDRIGLCYKIGTMKKIE